MKVFAFLCVVATAMAIPGPDKRIVKGSPPAVLFAHPHQASIQVNNNGDWHHMCGGSLIADNKVLTAAHCLEGQTASKMRVEFGTVTLFDASNGYEQIVSVSSFVIHADYNPNSAGIPNDIGLIYLSSTVTLNEHVQIATLAPSGSSFDNTKCFISGFGFTSKSGPVSPQLLEVKLTQLTTDDCASRWPEENINIKHICIFDDSETDPTTRPGACMGDSGGPMMCGDTFEYLAGVTSWGGSSCSGKLLFERFGIEWELCKEM
ncbi:unnamed protein product [Candidula unifasciata]|uniref:Peptidase S1 domain-containing protein n=1 Tax=Candidula unifasciata TaxID=100452 RepID=A0A8S3YN66_9EUPU|nr:unnamed protein product [Candidula unifasciata]